jgi:hypothetical protein
MSRATHVLGALILILLATGTPQRAEADAACENDCWTQWYACEDSCGPGGDYWCHDTCDQARDQCLTSCANCPITRDYTTRTILSRQYTNRNGCYQDHLYFTGGRRYYEYYTKERRDNYRETTQCNGTKSTQLLSSTTLNYYCWVRGNTSGDSCSSPAPNYLFICN